jgi:hypothetical protein
MPVYEERMRAVVIGYDVGSRAVGGRSPVPDRSSHYRRADEPVGRPRRRASRPTSRMSRGLRLHIDLEHLSGGRDDVADV